MPDKYLIEDIFGIKGFSIAWYGAVIAFGMFLGTILAVKEARHRGYKADLIIDFILLAIPIAIICARIYYVIFEWQFYAASPVKVFAIWEGGLAIYGGVIGGFLSALIFSKVNSFPLFKLIDIVVPSLILGQSIGRWGNFFNQEAFGNIVVNSSLQFFPYAVYIDRLSEWHQATFFYESIWNLLIFLVLIFYKNRAKFDGSLLAIYLIGYGTGRFFIEGLRNDSLYIISTLRVSQALSFVLIFLGLALFIFHKKFEKYSRATYKGKYSL